MSIQNNVFFAILFFCCSLLIVNKPVFSQSHVTTPRIVVVTDNTEVMNDREISEKAMPETSEDSSDGFQDVAKSLNTDYLGDESESSNDNDNSSENYTGGDKVDDSITNSNYNGNSQDNYSNNEKDSKKNSNDKEEDYTLTG